MVRWKWIIVLLLAVSTVSLWAQGDIQLKAYVSRAVVGLNDNFTYTVEISGSAKSLPEVNLPDLSAFKILSGPSVSSSFQMINFQMTASKSYQFVLLPKKTGQFVIPAATANVDGKVIKSNTINITVVPGTLPTQPGKGSTAKDVFFKAVPSKTSAYLHEQITVIYKIYYRTRIANPALVDAPEVTGCWQEEFQLKQLPQYTEVVNGVQYKVVEIYRMVLFPTRNGTVTVSPMRISLDVMEKQRRRRNWDPFFDDFFSSGFGEWKQKIFSSNPITITVKPLPAQGRPANFSGLVGQFRLTTFLDKTMAQTNQALTYRVKITGTGNADFLTDLAPRFPRTFEVYDPKVKGSKALNGNQYNSTKIFEYVVIPRVPGQFTVPPLEVPYFDPSEGRYKILKSPAYQLMIEKSPDYDEALARTFVPKADVELLGQDIEFIRETPEKWQRIGATPFSMAGVIALMMMPVLALGIVVGVQRYREKMATNVGYARRQRAARQARERLKEARRRLASGAMGEFYSAVATALIGFVADKTNRSAAGLTQEDVRQILAEKQVDSALQQEFFACLQEADFKRFAPAQATPEEGKHCLERAETLLKNLMKYFD